MELIGRNAERSRRVTHVRQPHIFNPKELMELIRQQIDEAKRIWKNKRQLTHQGLNLVMVMVTALMIWKGLMLWTQSESPVVVVLSGSMEPAFQRGDILYLDNNVFTINTSLYTVQSNNVHLFRNLGWRPETLWFIKSKAAKFLLFIVYWRNIDGVVLIQR